MNSNSKKILKGVGEEILNVKETTQKRRFELTWANIPNTWFESWD